MILRLALRSLVVRPIRTLVLVCGFGLGVAVMAILLGVGEVILEQAKSPALQGGGDLVVSGGFGSLENSRFVQVNVLGSTPLRTRVKTVSPSKRTTLYLMTPGQTWTLVGRAGVPSLETAIGDRETVGQTAWVDEPADRAWRAPDAAEVLRAIDGFHAPPDVPEFAASWAEWLYFNGRDNATGDRFYLTFLMAAAPPPGSQKAGRMRAGVVRLQLERAGKQTSYSAVVPVDEPTVLASAPDLDFGANRVRLVGHRYRIDLRLEGEGANHGSLSGQLTLDAAPGQSLPPTIMHGARGWMSGYVVPALSGTVRGTLEISDRVAQRSTSGPASAPARETLSLDMRGYHDHNWGFWQDVRWQWGQVTHDDLSFVFGRVFPPASVADPARVPGFLGVLGPDGPLGLSTDVTIKEQDAEGQPVRVDIVARGSGLDLRFGLTVDRTVRTQFRAGAQSGLDFLQLGGLYQVTGEAAGRPIAFTARGAAETFRQK
jgi:hypothetical protein